jgi:hypothetical protein
MLKYAQGFDSLMLLLAAESEHEQTNEKQNGKRKKKIEER